MEVVRALPDGETAVMAVTLSSSPHILAFYWNGSTIVPKWVCREKTTLKPLGIEDLSIIHKSIVGLTLEEDNGRIKVSFGIPVSPHDMYFAQLPTKEYGIVYHKDQHSAAHLREVFVEVSQAKATCFCRIVDLITGRDEVERIEMNIGPILALL